MPCGAYTKRGARVRVKKRSLPITSFFDPDSGASFLVHPAVGIARINGKFIQLPSRTTSQAPAHVYELGHPVAGLALNFATTTPVPSRSGTGGLAAVQMVILVWLCAVFAWLAVKAKTRRVSSTRVLANGTLVLASSVSHPDPFGSLIDAALIRSRDSLGCACAIFCIVVDRRSTPVNYYAESRADLYAVCGIPMDVAVIDPDLKPVTLNADKAVFTFAHVALGGSGESAISAVPSAATAFVHQDSQGQSEPVVIHPVHPTRLILNADEAAVVEMWRRLDVFVAQVELYGGGRRAITAVPPHATAFAHRDASSETDFVVAQYRDLLAWLPPCQLASDGQYVPVPVLSQESLDPGSFTLHQALQRRIVLPSSSNSGRQLPP
ncbi:hypothetical protein JB92DRAFT_3118078 [Gautieria morchelliformis]|nr:hypothetical protein JB92DRAFT_3118078 [Gautieria morchelliformis]